MTASISRDGARRFLALYHLTPTDVPGVFDRLGTVQYDPLNPLGRNPDLVFQARVPGYQVDDWHRHAYADRLAYDAWDKQACLVPIDDWPMRAIIRDRYHPWHDRAVLAAHPQAVAASLAEIDARGPLSSLEFEDRTRAGDGHSWLGPTRIKRILRALWAQGLLVTHHRRGARHYYDRPERVIPARCLNAPALTDDEAYHRWIVLRRHQAAGLLRPRSDQSIWSVCGDAEARALAISQLVGQGTLIPVRRDGEKQLYHVPACALDLLHAAETRSGPALDRMVFMAPLDSLLWDRRAVTQFFGFDYAWEVYKPETKRTWGYYVLPVFYHDRFVARFDSRLEDGVWTVARWWWEEDISPDADLLEALSDAARRFAHYLRAGDIRVADGVDPAVRICLHRVTA